MARDAAEGSAHPVVVVTNLDEDCSPEAFRALIDELLAGPEPDLETIDAAAALRQIHTDAGA